MDFVLVQHGKALGPYSTQKVETGIASGEITKTARIWRPPWTEWVSITELFPIQFGLTANLFAEMESKGEMRHKPEEDIFERVHREVPTPRIEQLLRQAKQVAPNASEVRVTSKNKEELVYQNLRDAIRQGHIQKSTVESLVQELEETGGQRIFLFRLKPDVDPVRLGLTFEGTAERLLGKNWCSVEFPVFHHLPAEPQISSFREYAVANTADGTRPAFAPAFASGWVLRIDACVRSEERLKATPGIKSSIFTHTYVPKLQDAVCVVRYWTTPRILEIRIPSFSSRELVTSLRESVISAYGNAFHFKTAFAEWEMPKVCTRMLKQLLTNPASEPTLRRVSGSLFRERDRSTMKIEIENQDAADIRESDARLNSVNAYLKEGSVVESMIAFFKLTKSDPEIRVVVGADDLNELSVRKTISAKELDHVIFRIHAHS